MHYHRLRDRGRCEEKSQFTQNPGKHQQKGLEQKLNISFPNTLINTSALSQLAGYQPCPINPKCLLSFFVYSYEKLSQTTNPSTRRNTERPKKNVTYKNFNLVMSSQMLITNQPFHFCILSVSEPFPIF